MDKNEARIIGLSNRRSVSYEDRSQAAAKLKDIIIEDELFKGSSNILLYASMSDELGTDAIITYALNHGKNVYLPLVKDPDMIFLKYSHKDPLNKGYKGIMEPIEESALIWNAATVEDSCIIMPGVAFDRQGNRAGFGKGFYDRFLAGNRGLIPRSLAVGFQCQLVDEIDVDDNDVKPGRIVLI